MMMIHAAVCDDEPFMVRELSRQLTEYMEKTGAAPCRISAFSSGRALLECGHAFDVIFLDIQMAHPDGMETARALRQRGVRSLLIFVTVLQECVFDAFEVEAWAYLLKPLDGGQFSRTMDRALRALAQRRDGNLLIRRGTACEVIPLEQILYCEVQGRKIYLHLTDGRTVSYYEKLEDLEQRLDGRFFRCHRSYLVNLACVRGLRGGQVTLMQGGAIPVSRLRERDLTQALLRYMREKDL